MNQNKVVGVRTTGMHCPSCAMVIELSLSGIPGVESAKVSYTDGLAKISYDSSLVDKSAIVAEIESLGYGVDGMEE